MLGFEPVPEPCFPIHCAMGTIEISDKCLSNHKNMSQQRPETGRFTSKIFVANALPRAFIHNIK